MTRGDQKRRKFIELVEKLFERWGYSRMEGKTYAILLINAKPMTISELAKETGASRSSVSIALSRLVREYMVTYRKRGKTKYFSAVPVFLEKFLQQPKEILEREIRPMKEIVEGIIESAGEEKKAFYQALLEDLSTLECVLERLIEFEESEELCIKKNSS
ncbi:GbsR/MarR family transcriptional regulator [Thermococcus gorgonarius]|uniref:HTH-type transcriptional regulator n=1 Tax=Thermococcus gorgonarius TaxID=71997 RepID=A0A2Z2M8K1_THEGO|nr:helix-turn-helix domain-containing protein [Thermococcus gorgonarius]ASJ00795.1 transcriptional regulator [Thermococcus gorgonarius]